MKTTIDPEEISHFAMDSARWWEENGPFGPLHRMNPVRMGFIRDEICRHFGEKPSGLRPLAGRTVLDIGCGGGLACESLARMGAAVTGIDADATAIAVAIDHAGQSGLDIAYRHGGAESLLPAQAGRYDVVTALEIVEHVSDLDAFVASAAALCKPGGLLVFSTLNQTARSFALGIVAAEYILRWVPRGTHRWRKFVRPAVLAAAFRRAELSSNAIKGIVFNPFSGEFQVSDKDIAVNYVMTAVK
ncbi:MAG: bifunctional 2-polyprenyl-6-hydroxyphenol methylase/3-demethylubiquinol 3-O-methyltransferase UbiG [Alphaproteobacteria bacterium]|nr:bifunctional 2-polyprenyl-6-hydroxyphenol methylase/3-demethylubiquinol 3-O-methyltransferase UbiG [Alphaproteobacteria bacterium]